MDEMDRLDLAEALLGKIYRTFTELQDKVTITDSANFIAGTIEDITSGIKEYFDE